MATGTLTGSSVATRYKSLLKLTGTANDVLAADASAKYIEDGDGNDSALSLSTTRVGIGTTSPTSKLTVLANESGGYAGFFQNDGNDADRYGLRVTCGEDAFSGAAKGVFVAFQDGDGGAMGNISNSSNIDLPEFIEGSDARIKENIADTKIVATTLLNQLKLREFNKKGHGKTDIGLIAQEVKDVMPELVSTLSSKDTQWEEFLDDTLLDDNGNKLYYNIGTGILPYYFIKAIQELSAKVTALESA